MLKYSKWNSIVTEQCREHDSQNIDKVYVMNCNDISVRQNYLMSDDPDTTEFGCMPSGVGEPSNPPNPDEIPFYFDMKSEELYYYTCDPEMWTKIDKTIADLDPVDIDGLSNPQDKILVPIVYDIGGTRIEGLVPLSELLKGLCTNPITSIAKDDNGNIVVTKCDNSQEVITFSVGEIDSVIRDGDNIVINQGKKTWSVSILDSQPVTYDDQKVIGFGTEGDNIVITMLDGTKHNLTRQEFAEWLAAEGSPMTTDAELAAAIANGTGNLRDQIDALQDELDAINTDQATHFVRGMNLVLRNEDGSESVIPLQDLIPLSTNTGQQIEWRDDGIYYGDIAPPNLERIYVDAERGNDTVSLDNGGGTISKPFKTLAHALAISPVDKSNRIYINSVADDGLPQEYTVTASRNTVLSGATRQIISYGEQPNIIQSEVDDILTRSDYFMEINTTKYIRPKILFDTARISKVNGDEQDMSKFAGDGSSKVIFRGCEVAFTDDKYNLPYRTGGEYIAQNISLEFDATDITRTDNSNTRILINASGETVNLSFDNANMSDNFDGFEGYIRLYKGSINVSSIESDGVARDGTIDPYDYPFVGNNTIPFLQQPNVFLNLQRHPSGVPINLTSDFVI